MGKELERGFYLFGNMALSMLGMIVISPLLADLMAPLFEIFANSSSKNFITGSDAFFPASLPINFF